MSKELQERINLAKAKMGEVIKDFQSSDAPQFKGKSKEKIRQMAIAAKLEAERGPQKTNEDLRKWFGKGKTGDWVRVGTDGEIKGACAREPGEGKPKCMPRAKAHSMDKDDRATSARRKRREDPVADRRGKGNKPVMVNTEEFMLEGNEPTNPALWSKAKSMAKKKFDVYPSAYANGWAAKYYKSKGGKWKTVKEDAVNEKCWDGYKRVGMKKKDGKMVPNCVPEENMQEQKDKQEYDYEGDMAMSQLKSIIANAKRIHDMLDEDTNLPEWVQSKITLAEDYISTAANYMQGEMNEETQLDELSKWHVKINGKRVSRHFDSEENAKRFAEYGQSTQRGKFTVHKSVAEEVEQIDEAMNNDDQKFVDRVLNSKSADSLIKMHDKLHPKSYYDEPNPSKSHLIGKIKKKIKNIHHFDQVRNSINEEDDGWYTHAQMHGSKRSEKHPKGISAAEWKTGIRWDHRNNKRINVKESKDDIPFDGPYRKSGERKDKYGNTVKNVAKHLAKKAMNKAKNMQEEAEQIDEFMGKIPPPGPESIAHRKANTAMRLKVADDRRKARLNKKKTAMEEFEQIDENAKIVAHLVKRYGDNVRKSHVMSAAKDFGVDASKLSMAVRKHLGKTMLDEELGKDNEWGRPELRKKFASMTPGQESMTKDSIPEMDVFSGESVMKEEPLNEISALGAKKREQFQAKIRKSLSDPKRIAKAKKQVAKKKAAEAEKPKNLLHQLHKTQSLNDYKVHFHSGEKERPHPGHVKKFIDKYHSLKSSIEKEALTNRAHKSHDDFKRVVNEECNQCEMDNNGINPRYDDVMNKDSGGRIDDYDIVQLEHDVMTDIDGLTWEDMVDQYEDSELVWVDNPILDGGEGSEEVSTGELSKLVYPATQEVAEALSPQGRLKKKFAAMRTRSRRTMARNLALKRVSSPDRLKKRAVRSARNMVYKRLLRGRDKSSLSASEKTRIEAMIKRFAPMVSRLTVRLIPQERKIEQKRLINRSKRMQAKKK